VSEPLPRLELHTIQVFYAFRVFGSYVLPLTRNSTLPSLMRTLAMAQHRLPAPGKGRGKNIVVTMTMTTTIMYRFEGNRCAHRSESGPPGCQDIFNADFLCSRNCCRIVTTYCLLNSARYVCMLIGTPATLIHLPKSKFGFLPAVCR